MQNNAFKTSLTKRRKFRLYVKIYHWKQRAKLFFFSSTVILYSSFSLFTLDQLKFVSKVNKIYLSTFCLICDCMMNYDTVQFNFFFLLCVYTYVMYLYLNVTQLIYQLKNNDITLQIVNDCVSVIKKFITFFHFHGSFNFIK